MDHYTDSQSESEVDPTLKEYVGYIWIGEEPGLRLSVWAHTSTEAGNLVEEEYGRGHPYTLRNDEDAGEPR